MSTKNWGGGNGLFQSDYNWVPSEAPAAGDNLYIQSGISILFNDAFGSADARSSIGLIGDDANNPPLLVLWNATLTNVAIDNAPPPYTGPADQAPADYSRHGELIVGGVVTNDGGVIQAGRVSGPPVRSSLDIVIAPGSTLVNNGLLEAGPFSTMSIVGYDESTLQNDQLVQAGGGKLTISAHLTGTGTVAATSAFASSAQGNVELQAAVDAGQTFRLSQATMQIDQPLSFQGGIQTSRGQGGGAVTLEGLSAASWDINDNTVELFDAGGSIVDTLRFTTPQDATTLAVFTKPDATYASSIVVGTIITPNFIYGNPAPGSLLPYQTPAAA